MTRKRHSTNLFRRTSLARVLSSLLLVLIVYGTTIEAAHRHGRVLKTEACEQSHSVSSPGVPTNQASGQFNCSECLICQLQKTFRKHCTVRAVSSPPRARLELIHCGVAFQSETNAPQKGRGLRYLLIISNAAFSRDKFPGKTSLPANKLVAVHSSRRQSDFCPLDI